MIGGSIISKFTVTPLLYAILGLVIVLGVQSGRLYLRGNQLTAANAEKKTAVESLASANTEAENARTSSNQWQATTTDLQAKLKTETDKNVRLEQSNQIAVDSATKRETALSAALDAARKKRAGLLNKPDCAKFLEMQLCPDLQ